uniref:Uncharacterized protein n=1 Tax=Plectus sambesii TaxID=2011161 RepID=A0A914WC49_9BILA
MGRAFNLAASSRSGPNPFALPSRRPAMRLFIVADRDGLWGSTAAAAAGENQLKSDSRYIATCATERTLSVAARSRSPHSAVFDCRFLRASTVPVPALSPAAVGGNHDDPDRPTAASYWADARSTTTLPGWPVAPAPFSTPRSGGRRLIPAPRYHHHRSMIALAVLVRRCCAGDAVGRPPRVARA